jgi:hypothetical protein
MVHVFFFFCTFVFYVRLTSNVKRSCFTSIQNKWQDYCLTLSIHKRCRTIKNVRSVVQGCTNLERKVNRATKFCTVAPAVFRIIIEDFFRTYKSVYQFTCTEQRAPDNSEIQSSLHNCGNCLMLRDASDLEWFQHFLKICGPSHEDPFEIANNEGFGFSWKYINRLRCLFILRHQYTALSLQDSVIWFYDPWIRKREGITIYEGFSYTYVVE